MLPRETTVRQLKKLRAETKGKDIGDLTVNDRLNKNLPNLQYIGNPVDMDIESWDEFSKKDSQLQSIAFKSKLVNKPLVKENNTKIMNECENVLKFKDFEKNWKPEEPKKSKRTDVAKDIVNEAKDDQPEYTMLGQEKELESNPNFGIGAVKDKEIKKIAFFNNFGAESKLPKERPVLNAGQFIDNDKIKGYVNRIDGKDVYIESLDEPMTIKKFSLKDAVKTKKEE